MHVLLLGVLYGGIPFAVIDADERENISGMFNDMQFNHLIVDVRHGTLNGEHVLNVLQFAIAGTTSYYTTVNRRKARYVLQRLFGKNN